jgi:hypothetical protein
MIGSATVASEAVSRRRTNEKIAPACDQIADSRHNVTHDQVLSCAGAPPKPAQRLTRWGVRRVACVATWRAVQRSSERDDRLGAEERRSAAIALGSATSADKQTKSREPPLHSWESPDWSILDDKRGNLPAFPRGLAQWHRYGFILCPASKGRSVAASQTAISVLISTSC